MKKTARYLALFLVVNFIISLSACGSQPEAPAVQTPKQTTDNTPTPTETPEASTTAAVITYPLTDEETIFTAWSAITPACLQYMDSRTTNPVVKAVNEATGVTLQVIDVGALAAREQFQIMFAAEEWPDFCAGFHSYYTGGGFDTAVNENIIYDIAPHIAEWAPDYYRALLEHDLMQDVMTADGNIVQLADIYIEASQDKGLVIRKDWLDDVGLEVPSTYDELHEALMRFKTELNKPGAFFLSSTGASGGQTLGGGYLVADSYASAINSFPYSMDNDTVVFGWTQDEYKDLLHLYSMWFSEELIWSDYMTSGTMPILSSNSSGHAEFAAGNLGVAYTEYGDLVTMSEHVEGMAVAPMVSPTKHSGEVNYLTQGADTSGNGFVIMTSCDDLKMALNYMNYYYTNDGMILKSWGIEDLTYKMEGDQYSFTELVANNPDGMSFNVAINVYVLNFWPGITDKSRDLSPYVSSGINAAEIWTSNADYSRCYPVKSKNMMTAEESAMWSAAFAEITTYRNETVNKFIIGELDIDENWDEYLARMEELGASDCTSYIQAAYDRYILK